MNLKTFVASGEHLEDPAQALSPSRSLRSKKSCHWGFVLKMCEELLDTMQYPRPRNS